MAWITYADTVFDTGKPGKGSVIEGIYKNITAMANGDSGAPEIQTAALVSHSIGTDILAETLTGGVGVYSIAAAEADGTLYTTIPAGWYLFAITAATQDSQDGYSTMQANVNGAWRDIFTATVTASANDQYGGFIVSDGTNVRISARCDTLSKATTTYFHYRKLTA